MARLPYTKIAPKAYDAMIALGHYLHTETALEPVLVELVFLRASLLNGCGFCIGMHKSELKKKHEPETRIEAVAEWAASDAFTPKEKAALRWTDVLTKLEPGGASDEEFAAVSAFFDEKDVVDLTFAIANINAWNRLGVGFATEWKVKV